MEMFLFQAAFDCAIDYAQNRSAFGKPIATLQTIQVLPFLYIFFQIVHLFSIVLTVLKPSTIAEAGRYGSQVTKCEATDLESCNAERCRRELH